MQKSEYVENNYLIQEAQLNIFKFQEKQEFSPNRIQL